MDMRNGHLKLGIVSDEISNDFAEAVHHASAWGIDLLEIRLLKSGRIPRVDKTDIEEVRRYLAETNMRITALSPGMFKHHLSKTRELEEELNDVLPRTIDLANMFGAPLIIVFGFQREEGEPGTHRTLAIDFLRRASAAAEEAGIKIAVENEPGFWCDTGVNTRELIDEVNSPALGANWDPANACGTAERPYPEGYDALKDRIFNVHVKDTKTSSLVQCVPVGEGLINWEGQLRALMRDGIVPHVTIETHCLPLIENSRHNVDVLRNMMNRIAAGR